MKTTSLLLLGASLLLPLASSAQDAIDTEGENWIQSPAHRVWTFETSQHLTFIEFGVEVEFSECPESTAAADCEREIVDAEFTGTVRFTNDTGWTASSRAMIVFRDENDVALAAFLTHRLHEGSKFFGPRPGMAVHTDHDSDSIIYTPDDLAGVFQAIHDRVASVDFYAGGLYTAAANSFDTQFLPEFEDHCLNGGSTRGAVIDTLINPPRLPLIGVVPPPLLTRVVTDGPALIEALSHLYEGREAVRPSATGDARELTTPITQAACLDEVIEAAAAIEAPMRGWNTSSRTIVEEGVEFNLETALPVWR